MPAVPQKLVGEPEVLAALQAQIDALTAALAAAVARIVVLEGA